MNKFFVFINSPSVSPRNILGEIDNPRIMIKDNKIDRKRGIIRGGGERVINSFQKITDGMKKRTIQDVTRRDR